MFLETESISGSISVSGSSGETRGRLSPRNTRKAITCRPRSWLNDSSALAMWSEFEVHGCSDVSQILSQLRGSSESEVLLKGNNVTPASRDRACR